MKKINKKILIFMLIMTFSFLAVYSNPIQAKANKSLNSSYAVTDIAAGGSHSLAILSDGRLFAWGDNSNGQLGDGTTDNKNIPIEIQLNEGVKPVQIACGFNHSLAIGDDGCLYAWGSNCYGQLGNDSTEDSCIPVKVKLPDDVKPIQISCGDDFSMVICEDGNLYTWGNDDYGQLGNGVGAPYYNHAYFTRPTLIKLSGTVNPIKISCGSQFAMAIGDDGYIYGWGCNENNELNDSYNRETTPKIVDFSKYEKIKSKQIACGSSHVITLSNENNLYGWGSSISGSLGDYSHLDNDYSHNKCYYKLNLPDDVAIKSITSDSSNSTAVIDENGSLYMTGWNYYGQLGNGSDDTVEDFTRVNFAKGVKAKKVAFGYSHSLVLGDNGKVYSSGSNEYGELGDGSNNKSCAFKPISFISNSDVDEPNLNVDYRTHVQSYGWQDWVSNGAKSGTEGKAKRLEGINIKVSNSDYSGGISYKTHVQKIGWQNWVSNGALSGTEGRALRLEAIQIKLTDELAEHYDIYYRVHAQHFGWMGWSKNGAAAGTSGYAYRLEGIQIVIVPKGDSAPGSTSDCYKSK